MLKIQFQRSSPTWHFEVAHLEGELGRLFVPVAAIHGEYFAGYNLKYRNKSVDISDREL